MGFAEEMDFLFKRSAREMKLHEGSYGDINVGFCITSGTSLGHCISGISQTIAVLEIPHRFKARNGRNFGWNEQNDCF